ncbi:zf-TFIIB domain-containing protein [Lysobacter sp. MMG2]|uniref:TFIIB-type zinc ribbon-containing protein n=1 Tax=Lysobacter sp. MMG2 TaxID=2801338 RepID=UPI001C22A8E0|nr:zf-TFIIB domain-containing protein [Lysobacter sp. MMG2]
MTMQCPKCDSTMQPLDIPSSRSLRCTQCQGLWVSVGEERELHAHADGVDTGDIVVGQRYNQIDRITCPSCPDCQLIRMVDAAQPHIWFESCGVCFGRFYDAGELRDSAEHTVMEFIRDLDAPERV